MPRKKKQSLVPPLVPARPPAASNSSQMLVNKLSVADARHLVNCEGGYLSGAQLVFQVAFAVAVAALLARAIWVGNATMWHLLMPMFAQYLGIVLSLPPIYLVVRHPDLRRDARNMVMVTAMLAAAAGVTIGVRAHDGGVPWRDQLAADAWRFWRWIVDAQMHWPILIAFLGMVAAMPGRVRNLIEHGPPFVSVSLGCAMRFVVPILLCFLFPLLPWAMETAARRAWCLWGLIVSAEVLALWMHWDLSRRLKKLDAGVQAKATR